MANSLQAALVIPVVLSGLAGLAGLVLPTLKAHEQTARSLVQEQRVLLTLDHLYQLPSADRPALLTSPQQLVAWIALAEDVLGLWER